MSPSAIHLHTQDVRIEGRRIRPHDVSTDGQDDVASDDEDGHCLNRPSSRRSLRGPVAATLTLVCSTFINIELAYRPLCSPGAALCRSICDRFACSAATSEQSALPNVA